MVFQQFMCRVHKTLLGSNCTTMSKQGAPSGREIALSTTVAVAEAMYIVIVRLDSEFG